MGAAGCPLRCAVTNCGWFAAAALTVSQQRILLGMHERAMHSAPAFPPESKLFALPAVPCRKCGILFVDHGGRDHAYERPTLASDVAAMAAGEPVRPELASDSAARIHFEFTGTPAEFRAWCRAYVDGAGK